MNKVSPSEFMSEDKNVLTKQIRENMELASKQMKQNFEMAYNQIKQSIEMASNQTKQNIEMTAAMSRYFSLIGGTHNTEVNAAIENAKNEMMASVEKVKDSFWKDK